ncbi:MAG: hypothetical protein ACKO7B_17065 [Flavobacteriales bacterium]
MMNKSTKCIVGGIFAVMVFVAISGCNKDQQTIATITVVNDDGEPVPGASVRLYAVSSETPPPPNEIRFDTTQVTNGTGKASFDFTDYYQKGQAGFAVLDIEAKKGSLEGEGIIKIEELKINEETVVIE